MSENCRFLGALEECEFPQRAGFWDHVIKVAKDPIRVGINPSSSLEEVHGPKDARIHGLVCGSKITEDLIRKVRIQRQCNGYRP